MHLPCCGYRCQPLNPAVLAAHLTFCDRCPATLGTCAAAWVANVACRHEPPANRRMCSLPTTASKPTAHVNLSALCQVNTMSDPLTLSTHMQPSCGYCCETLEFAVIAAQLLNPAMAGAHLIVCGRCPATLAILARLLGRQWRLGVRRRRRKHIRIPGCCCCCWLFVNVHIACCVLCLGG
jgi:hypothetical protein